MNDELISTSEAMAILEVSRHWVIELINDDKLEGKKVGKQYVITLESVETYRKEVQKK